MKKTVNYAKIGVFVFMSMVILLLITISLNRFLFFKMRTMQFQFDSVDGLDKGSFIMVEGVKVGTVTDIQIVRSQHPVLVQGQIEKDIPIYMDYRITIASSGIIGEKIIMIDSGSMDRGEIDYTVSLVGMTSQSIDDTIVRFNEVASQVNQLVGHVNDIIGQQSFKSEISQLTTNLSQASRDVSLFTNQSLPVLTNDFHKMSDALIRMETKIDQTLTTADQTLKDISSASRKIPDDLDMTLGEFRKSSQILTLNFSKTLKEIDQTTHDIRKLSRTADALLGDVSNEKGVLHYLIYDDALYQNTNSLIYKLKYMLNLNKEMSLPSWEYEVQE